MSFVFIVVKDNIVEQVKVFKDYFVGDEYANEYIKQIDPNIKDFPKYRQGEYYHKYNLCIGLYNGKEF